MSMIAEIPQQVQERVSELVTTSYANSWTLLPVAGLSKKAQDLSHRLNGLGQLFYFTKIILRKHRMREHLHKRFLCDPLESYRLKNLIEFPRDHFKSTICSEAAPIWWALPFSNKDEDTMRILGYGDEWIRWMRRAHNQNTRTLLVSENITNAGKLGLRIDYHYKNNDIFMKLYPEIQLDTSCPWSVITKTHKRTTATTAAQGEGTFDYIGVGGALQSRHYDRVIQDDIVGKEAIESELVMQSTIDYHRLLIGAFDSDPDDPDNDNDELVVGNRWGYRDLNYWIREHEKRFVIYTHSALGGCCKYHPFGQPIFPEEFGLPKLNDWKIRLGTYFYSCQFLNSPTPPGDTKFLEKNINYYKFATVDASDKRVKIVHEPRNGQVQKDLLPGHLQRHMIVDPNHAGEEGRSRHAIAVTGFQAKPVRVYLLDVYAENSSHADLVHQVYRLAEKWKLREVNLETISAQKWLKYHFEVENEARRKDGKWTIRINELKIDRGKDAKMHRIESLEPMFERQEFYMCRNGQENFLDEYLKYPYAGTRDIMDVLGYSSQLWNVDYSTKEEVAAYVKKQEYAFKTRVTSTGY